MLIHKKQRLRHTGAVCNVAQPCVMGKRVCWVEKKNHMKYSEDMFPQGICFIQYQKKKFKSFSKGKLNV